MLAAGMLAVGAISCSDNLDAELEPIKSVRTLEVTLDGKEIPNHTLDLGAAPSNTLISVESNTRWAVEITDCLGGWCDIDVLNGSGDGSFTITVLDNMKEKRDCYVTIYKTDAEGNKETDGSVQIKVEQAVSDVRLTPSSLSPFAPDQNGRQDFEITSNVSWTLEVTYEGGNSTRFVNITPTSGSMTDNGDGTFSGDGAASFYISLQNNRTAADRKAYLTLHSAVANYSVELTQLKSLYNFDVSPAENQILPASGGTVEFGVLSIVDWDVTTVADWITFSNTSGTSSDSRVNTVATIQPNTTGMERSAIVRFVPRDKSYQEQSVTVTQRGFDLTFSVSSDDNVGVVPDSVRTMTLDLDSRFNWELTAPSWMTANPSSGNASGAYQTIGIQLDRNTTNTNRTGTVTITPLPTQFAEGVAFDPKELGIEPVKVAITQFGGREPAISVPWLVDGYGQREATVEFNYYSPFYEITGAGLQWRRAGTSDWTTVNATAANPTEGVVSVDLSGLDPATRYEARGFVTDNTGRTVYGSVSYPFTTAGHRPGPDDNPTPSN